MVETTNGFGIGTIALSEVNDPYGGNRKERPIVVVQWEQSTEKLGWVAITSEFEDPLEPNQVPMRWRPGKHPQTGLWKQCVAKTRWSGVMKISEVTGPPIGIANPMEMSRIHTGFYTENQFRISDVCPDEIEILRRSSSP